MKRCRVFVFACHHNVYMGLTGKDRPSFGLTYAVNVD